MKQLILLDGKHWTVSSFCPNNVAVPTSPSGQYAFVGSVTVTDASHGDVDLVTELTRMANSPAPDVRWFSIDDVGGVKPHHVWWRETPPC